MRSLIVLGIVLILLVVIGYVVGSFMDSYSAARSILENQGGIAAEAAEKLEPETGVVDLYSTFKMIVYGVAITVAVIVVLVIGNAIRRA